MMHARCGGCPLSSCFRLFTAYMQQARAIGSTSCHSKPERLKTTSKPLSCCWPGVARAIRVVSAVVTVRLPADIVRQRSSDGALSAMDTSSLSSVTTQSPDLGNTEPPSGLKRNSTQVVSAHDNGQVQVWDMSTGFLQPVLRMGLVGPSARSAFPAFLTTYTLSRGVKQLTDAVAAGSTK